MFSRMVFFFLAMPGTCVVSMTLIVRAPAPAAAVWTTRRVLALSPLTAACAQGCMSLLLTAAVSVTSLLMSMMPMPIVRIRVFAAPTVLAPMRCAILLAASGAAVLVLPSPGELGESVVVARRTLPWMFLDSFLSLYSHMPLCLMIDLTVP